MSSNTFRYVDTRPRTCPQPTGFYRFKAGQCYKTTLPPPQNGTHVKLHKNLSSRYSRPDTCGNKLAYSGAFHILYKQRPRQKIYTGQAPSNLYTAEQTTRKLACYDPWRQPPDSTLYRDVLYYPHTVCNKPLYSKAEVEAVVNRLYNKKKEEGRLPPLVLIDKKRQTYPAEMLEEIIDLYGSTNRLCPHPPYRNLFRDRTNAQEITASSKRLKESEFDSMVKRLNEYDDTKWPPNSTHVKTQDPDSPVRQKYPPPGSASTQRTIDVMVDRLYNSRWKAPDPGSPAGKRMDEEEEQQYYSDDDGSEHGKDDNKEE